MHKRWKQYVSILLAGAGLLLHACAPQQGTPYKTPSQQAMHEEFAYPGTPPARWEQGGNSQSMPYGNGSQHGQVIKIGLLLPLSGQSAELGKSLQDAAVLALFDKYASIPPGSGAPRIELVPKDTKGNAQGARTAAQEALNEGAQLFIGPLFAHSVEAAAPIARSRGVNIISFSNSKAVASPGVFLFGFNPAEQVTRVTEYAFMRNIQTIAALAPNSAYGQTVVEALQHTAAPYGHPVDPLTYYAASGDSLQADIAGFMKEGMQAGRLTFQALMLPESGANLVRIMQTLGEKGVRPGMVRFLGTGMWDDPLVRRSVNLSGGWFATAPPKQYAAFEDRFVASYGYQPLRIASLAYDAVALSTTLALQGDFTAATIANPNGYSAPANGVFRFKPDGTAERGLAVVEILPGGDIKLIDPAPRSFVR